LNLKHAEKEFEQPQNLKFVWTFTSVLRESKTHSTLSKASAKCSQNLTLRQ